MPLSRRAFVQSAGTGFAALAGSSLAFPADSAAVLESSYSRRDFELTADPNSELWSTAPHVTADRNYLGQPIPGAPTGDPLAVERSVSLLTFHLSL